MEDKELRDLVHGKLLELLRCVDGICKKEGIAYSLAGGTLLGAVRHNGFIPWDDDADIVMTRDEFNRFMSVADKYVQDTPFVTCKNGRVSGITYREPIQADDKLLKHLCLDVFVFDNVSDDDKKFKKQVFELKKLQGMMKKKKVNWKKYSLKGKILVLGTKFLGAFHSEQSILDKYEKISVLYNDMPTKRKFISNDIFSTFDIPYDNELIQETVYHKFETEEFPIFKEYDKILTMIYGDYMTPPPISERVFMHIESD